MINVKNLSKHYGDFPAVDDVTFHVGEGEIVGFLGPNGAGKTTTMRMLTCFIPATAGTATLAGFDIFRQSLQVRQNIGYLPENNPLYPDMRVGEYLSFRAKLKNVPPAERNRRIGEALDRCGAGEFARQVIGTLSKGQRQRVGLADCLLHNPRILILDEPTVGLDPNQIRHVRKLIKDLGKSHTVLLSTHILPEVESVCERFIIIHNGRIAAEKTMDDLRRSPHLDVQAVAPEAELRAAVAAVPGVIGVKAAGGAPDVGVKLTLELQPNAEVRHDICSLITAHNWKLLELRQRALTLEELFVSTTARESSGGTVEGGAL
ncbi:MAG TPA: ATP-binding cassette domain-containing protein [Planctomycetota bacterium]|nr:ATP-binding cassette domain-containing protein [Planctomycetota bacterium]